MLNTNHTLRHRFFVSVQSETYNLDSIKSVKKLLNDQLMFKFVFFHIKRALKRAINYIIWIESLDFIGKKKHFLIKIEKLILKYDFTRISMEFFELSQKVHCV